MSTKSMQSQVNSLFMTVVILFQVACDGNFFGKRGLNDGLQEKNVLGDITFEGLCLDETSMFVTTVWTPVIGVDCAGCHRPAGYAESKGSRFLVEPSGVGEAVANNLASLKAYIAGNPNGLSNKASGLLPHGGGELYKDGDAQLVILQTFEAEILANKQQSKACPKLSVGEVLTMSTSLNDAGLARRLTLRLADRLPTPEEIGAVAANGAAGLEALAQTLVEENGFLLKLQEFYNSILMTDAFVRQRVNNVASLLYPEIVNDMDPWYGQAGNFGNDTQAFVRAKEWTDRAVAREPLHLISYVVQQNKPFTEILTADYTVFNPFGACALGLQTRMQFAGPVNCTAAQANSYNPFDLQPVQMNQNHRGIFTTRAFMVRHTTTTTNCQRHRTLTILKTALGVDIMTFSATRLTPDVNANGEALAQPNCAVCHVYMDQMAAALGKWNEKGEYQDMACESSLQVAGFEGQAAQDANQGMNFLMDTFAKDRRFAKTTVGYMWRMLTHTQVVQPLSKGTTGVAAAFEVSGLQDDLLEQWTDAFIASNYNLKQLVKTIALHDLIRITNVAATADDRQVAKVATVVGTKILAPEELSRKLIATIGTPWSEANGQGLLNQRYFSFYGGLDWLNSTKPADAFSGLMNGVMLRMGADVSCKNVPLALSGDTSPQAIAVRRQLLGRSNGDVFAIDDLNEAAIQAMLNRWVEQLLGVQEPVTGPETQALWQVFQQTAQQAANKTLPTSCQVINHRATGQALPTESQLRTDSNGTVHGLMAALATVLTDIRFVTE